MTEHKYTDEEVIKAIEICQKAKCWGDCEDMSCPAASRQGCHFYLRTDEDYEGVIQDEMLKDALDLINRQKAEVERLTAEKDTLIKTYKFCMVEAIKEFAEKLGSYEEVVTTLKDGENIVAIDVHHIHRIIKEMTGENNQ